MPKWVWSNGKIGRIVSYVVKFTINFNRRLKVVKTRYVRVTSLSLCRFNFVNSWAMLKCIFRNFSSCDWVELNRFAQRIKRSVTTNDLLSINNDYMMPLSLTLSINKKNKNPSNSHCSWCFTLCDWWAIIRACMCLSDNLNAFHFEKASRDW